MKKKLKVVILFGGKSAEHEVSMRSARTVFAALDPKKYEPVAVAITKKGQWLCAKQSLEVLRSGKWPAKKAEKYLLFSQNDGKLIEGKRTIVADVFFPVLHGPMGEDGTLQGLLKLAGVAFVGAGVLGSAVGMDKDVMKRLLRDAGIPIGNFMTVLLHEKNGLTFERIRKNLGLPLFIKPANLGSSVGIAKVRNKQEFAAAIENAFRYDTKILIEQFIEGREIECAVIGNDEIMASVPGEIIPQHDFYSYEAKYVDENGAILEIPAKLPASMRNKVQTVAADAYVALCCEGLARVDMFLTKDGNILINEINTLPGFTSISMFPKLWEECGISNRQLVDILINLAMERFEKERNR